MFISCGELIVLFSFLIIGISVFGLTLYCVLKGVVDCDFTFLTLVSV